MGFRHNSLLASPVIHGRFGFTLFSLGHRLFFVAEEKQFGALVLQPVCNSLKLFNFRYLLAEVFNM